jgi:hypothetical protein
MKRFTIYAPAITIALFIWGNQAMALKAVSRSKGDSAQVKNPPSTPEKPADSNQAPNPAPPSDNQRPQTPTRPDMPKAPQDNFIDRDGDGINDNIKQHKEPEIKRERAEPSKPIETPRKSEPVKSPEKSKESDSSSSSKKHK